MSDLGGLAELPLDDAIPAPRPTVPEVPETAGPTTRPAAIREQPVAPVSSAGPAAGAGNLTGDWGGLRSGLDARGLSITGTLTSDIGKPLGGGRDTGGSAVVGLFSLGLTLDTSKAFGWTGGTAFASFQQRAGQIASDEVGDYQ